MGEEPIAERDLQRLRWRCRRGLLENDLLVQRFLERHAARLNVRQGKALMELMSLADGDLLDLLLRRTEPEGELDTTSIREVLELLRPESVPADGAQS